MSSFKIPFDYDHCRVCGKDVPAWAHDIAARRTEDAHCGSPECRTKELVARFGCCDKAKPLSRFCVCAYAFECPVHGEKHIGTHD